MVNYQGNNQHCSVYNSHMNHYSVMAKDVMAAIAKLKLSRKFKVADCNFGLGGHSNLILNHFPNSSITGFQIDPSIYQLYKSSSNLHTADQSRLSLKLKNFTQITEQCKQSKFDVVLADLGYNSVQLEGDGGFAWTKDSPLDMRYSTEYQSCSKLINDLSSAEIAQILQRFGDFSLSESQFIASHIFRSKPITTTFGLRDCVVGCFQKDKTRKIAQVFQAFRICVNSQLHNLDILCQNLSNCVNPNGLVLMITFHSLQRDVIHGFLKRSKQFKKSKTVGPSDQQVKQNSKSACAKMIVFRKIA